jgi:hypothetical protein
MVRTEAIEYVGYELLAIHHPPVWQVSINPTLLYLPAALEHLRVVEGKTKDEAFANAKKVVDDLIKGT